MFTHHCRNLAALDLKFEYTHLDCSSFGKIFLSLSFFRFCTLLLLSMLSLFCKLVINWYQLFSTTNNVTFSSAHLAFELDTHQIYGYFETWA